MRRSRIICTLSVIIALILSAPCYPSSFGKTFYRSLSARLGKTRADYPRLSDSDFANFRMVIAGKIMPGKLFRSSSPISTWGNRSLIADKLAQSADIRTIINLADTDEGMKSQGDYPGSYYSSQKAIGLNLGMKYKSVDFRRKFARGLHFMAVNEPPYLIHCSLGKDRAGYVCAVIECLMGASWPEVERDYMLSFRNYFGILPGTREYDFVVKHEIRRFIGENFGVENPERVNLSDAAERYLRGMGVSVDDIQSIRQKLGGMQ